MRSPQEITTSTASIAHTPRGTHTKGNFG